MYRRQRTCAYQRLTNVSFSENFANVLNELSRTVNFKIMYLRVVLCTCVRSVHKLCSPACYLVHLLILLLMCLNLSLESKLNLNAFNLETISFYGH